MNARTETVETVHGEVEVEVADCDSCGNTAKAEDMVKFHIGDREGLACRICEDEGPVEFPAPELFGISGAAEWVIVVALWPLFVPLALSSSDAEARLLLAGGAGGALTLGYAYVAYRAVVFASDVMASFVASPAGAVMELSGTASEAAVAVLMFVFIMSFAHAMVRRAR